MTPDRPMTVQQLAAYFGAAPSTIYGYVRSGMGEAIGVKVGKAWRFYPNEVWQWLRKRQERERLEPAAQIVVEDIDMTRALARAGVRPQVDRKRPKKGGAYG